MSAPAIDENNESDVAAFIDIDITCSIPNEKEYPALNKLVNKVQQHRHTFTCRKKKGATCRFNVLWPPFDETQIVHGTNVSEEELKKSKEILDKVLSEVKMIDNDDATLTKVSGSYGVTEDAYIQTLTVRRKISVIYKKKPNETMISPPYNTVLLNLMKSNMNLQFVTGIYGLLAYLCSYMCKEKGKLDEIMRKVVKESPGLNVREKLRKVENVFLLKCEVSTHETSNQLCLYQ